MQQKSLPSWSLSQKRRIINIFIEVRRTMEKNKTRKGDGEERRAWVGLPLKLRWLDLWVSGGRPVQTERTARAEVLQGQQAGGQPRCSAWSEQGLYPQKPGLWTCFHFFDLLSVFSTRYPPQARMPALWSSWLSHVSTDPLFYPQNLA